MDGPPIASAPCLADPEAATQFVRRVFSDIFCDRSDASIDRALQVLHESFEQRSDGKVIDRAGFLKLMQAQKARLASAPRFTWSSLVATAPRQGVVHVTSVHSVALHLRDGMRLNQKVVALVQLDVEMGQILALSAILIIMGYWRRTRSFAKHAFTANVVLMTAGFVLTGYQLAGLFLGDPS